MRRVLGIGAVLAAATVVVILASGAGSASGQTYWVELDNAFGLVTGADVKVAGVRAGKIQAFKLDRRNYHARVEISLDQQGFDRLRSDAFCRAGPSP
jgi:ABC-type transporter Mla subunit MlaD